jgi:UDP-N-acetylglucosamine transferase subunit ALG13
MIFVTVGTHDLGFERLLKKMDDIAGKIDEEVIMQIGNTKYQPKHAKYFDFKNLQEMEQLIKEARVIVCHGGAGTILIALSYGKTVISVPRLIEFNEVFSDHQLDLVYTLANEKRIIAVYNLELLENTLNNLPKKLNVNNIKDGRLINFLKRYINTLVK